jgi:hypothetical protein
MRLVAYSLILAHIVVNTASAKCVASAHVKSNVTINQCVGIAVTAGPSSIGWFENTRPPLYQAGSSISGTLLSVNVEKSVIDPSSKSNTFEGSTEPWRAGENRALFVHGSAADVCPPVLPESSVVRTVNECCDVLPYDGICLVPAALDHVEIVSPGKGVNSNAESNP